MPAAISASRPPRRPRWLRRSVARRGRPAIALATVLLAVAACGGGHRAPAAPSRNAPDLQTIFDPAQAALQADPAGNLQTLRRLGVDRVKVYMPWSAIAPAATAPRMPAGLAGGSPAAYPAAAWTPYDAIMRAARAGGIGVDLTLGGPAPRWAAGPGEPAHGPAGVWEPSARAFGAFVHAVAARYSGGYRPPGAAAPLPRVSYWSIWNEPNYGQDLAPQAIDHSTVEVAPRLYRGLLDAAWSALAATGHGHDTILIGELAPRGITVGDNPGNFSGMVPLRFVRALYCVDASLHALHGAAASARGCPTTASGRFAAAHPALFRASGFAVHPYPQGRQAPTALTAFEPDYADLPALPRLESTLDRIQRAYGSSTRFTLYSTEFGYHTDPPETTVRAAPVKLAALYLNWAEYLSWRDPRIRSFDQYLLQDPGGGFFATGLEFSSGAPKPTLDAFRMPLFLPVSRAGKGQALEVWGCVRPVYYYGRGNASQSVRIEFASRAGGPFHLLRRVALSDPHGYFDVRVAFPGSGLVRLAWSYPHGPEIHSRLAAVAIG